MDESKGFPGIPDEKDKIECMSGGDFLLSVLAGMLCPYIVLAGALGGGLTKTTAIILLLVCLVVGTGFAWSRPVRSLLRRAMQGKAN